MYIGKSGVTSVCHGAFAMSAYQTPCHSVGRKIANVSLVVQGDLLCALGVSAGCRCRVVSDVVSLHLSLSVPCQSAAVHSRRPHGAWTSLCLIFGGNWAPPLACRLLRSFVCSSGPAVHCEALGQAQLVTELVVPVCPPAMAALSCDFVCFQILELNV